MQYGVFSIYRGTYTDNFCNSAKCCNRIKSLICCQMFSVNQFFFAITCILSEVTKVTKFIEGDGHLLEDEEIKRLLQGGNSVYYN